MKAAGLKAIDTVVSSTAVLIKSKSPTNPAMVDLIASRILGVISTFPVLAPLHLLTSDSGTKIRTLPI
jgi:ATP phosphoribosyltransferase